MSGEVEEMVEVNKEAKIDEGTNGENEATTELERFKNIW